MEQATAAAKAAHSVRITTPFQRVPNEKKPKIDIVDIVRNHVPTTGIIERIKASTVPFYFNITPEVALDLLTLNDFQHNRDLKWDNIHIYQQQMLSGEWCCNNGDTMSVSEDMKLIDGQNRLIAAYLAGFTIELMIIAPNCPPKSFAYKDIGGNRSASDMATINGYGTYKGQVAYAVKCILLYEKEGKIKSAISKNQVPNYEVNRFMQDKKRVERLIGDIGMAKDHWAHDTKNFFTVPQWAVVYFILRTLPGMGKEARIFMDQFAAGTELHAKSPIRVARKHFETEFKLLLQNKQRNRISNPLLTIKLNTLFTAWNHYVNRESINDIRIDVESKFIVKPIFR